MRNYIQPGEMIDFTITFNATAGIAYYINDVVVVAQATVAASPGKPAKCPMLNYGVCELPKNPVEIFFSGQFVYWDNTNKRLTLSSAGNKRIGFSVEPAASGDANCRAFISANS